MDDAQTVMSMQNRDPPPPQSPSSRDTGSQDDTLPSLGDWSPTSRRKIRAQVLEARQREREELQRYKRLKREYINHAGKEVLEARQLSDTHRLKNGTMEKLISRWRATVGLCLKDLMAKYGDTPESVINRDNVNNAARSLMKSPPTAQTTDIAETGNGGTQGRSDRNDESPPIEEASVLANQTTVSELSSPECASTISEEEGKNKRKRGGRPKGTKDLDLKEYENRE